MEQNNTDQINYASHLDQRVAVFIDTQNLYHSAKSNYRANVNYHQLMEKAINGRKFIRAFAYVIKSEENTEEKFFEAIEEIGIEIRVKDLQIFHTGAKKADWDVGIAVDMIRLTEKVDVVVLASGDGDFLEVVRYCQSRGVRVEVMAFEKTTNAKLMAEVDHFVDLGDSKSHFLIGGKGKSYSTGPRSSARASTYSAAVAKPSYAPASNYGSASYTPPQSLESIRPEPTGLPIESLSKPYSGSNLSAVNRTSNQNSRVNPRIYSSSTNRKIKPVVGLPAKYLAKPASSSYPGKVLINDETKNRKSLDNAFGNPLPKIRKKLF